MTVTSAPADHTTGTLNAEVLLVTPEIAGDWLTRNTHNRALRERTVDRYARDMSAGQWLYNGDPIRFDQTGVLLDGQHRLAAIVRSGATVSCLILRGLEPQTQETMDIGSARRLGDILALAEMPNPTLLAAILRRIVAYQHNYRHPTHAEMRTYLDEHHDVHRAVDVAMKGLRRVPAPASMVGAAYHLCAQHDRAAAEMFFLDQLINKLGLQRGDPARALSLRLEDFRNGRRKLDNFTGLGFMFLGWNAYRAGRKLERLLTPKGGFTVDRYPHPK